MKKDNTIEAFLALIRGGLWEQEVSLSGFDEIDYDRILRLAEEQAVVGLVAAGLEFVRDVKVPQQIALTFAGMTLQLEQRNKAMNVYIAELIEEMRSMGIYTLLVKGQGLAQCYHRPDWRSSGDVDLLLSKDNYEKAKAYIILRGELCEPEETSKKHLSMQMGQWAVELHGTLHVSLSARVDRMLDKVQYDIFYGGQVRSWMNGQTQVFLPGASEDVVYVFSHILQHFFKGGIGLRQICDWCRLLYTYRERLNYGYLKSKIEVAGLMSEWKTFSAFAVDYLGTPAEVIPLYSKKKKWSRKAESVLGFVLEVGNFGHNRDNSYFQKYSYFVQKCISAWRRIKDLCRHATIFPMSSIRFFFGIMYNGIVSTIKGE